MIVYRLGALDKITDSFLNELLVLLLVEGVPSHSGAGRAFGRLGLGKLVRVIPEGHLDRLIGLAFAAAVGITLLVLGCALHEFNNWWPMFVLTFYFLVPVPTLISRRMSGSFDTASSACVELCIFMTTGIVVSCLGFPIILARAHVILWGACALVLAGSIVVFLTILGYFYVFANDDMDYSAW